MNFLQVAGVVAVGGVLGFEYVKQSVYRATQHIPMVFKDEWAEFMKKEPDDPLKAFIVMNRIMHRPTTEFSPLGKIIRNTEVPYHDENLGKFNSCSIELRGRRLLESCEKWDRDDQRAFMRFKKVFDEKVSRDPDAIGMIAGIDSVLKRMNFLENMIWEFEVKDYRRV